MPVVKLSCCSQSRAAPAAQEAPAPSSPPTKVPGTKPASAPRAAATPRPVRSGTVRSSILVTTSTQGEENDGQSQASPAADAKPVSDVANEPERVGLGQGFA